MSSLERRYRWLLRAYPSWYRRERAGEMLGTLLEVSPPGAKWPSFRDARALVIGGLRVRGWAWMVSMLWVAAEAALTGYFFYVTTKPYSWADGSPGLEGWAALAYGASLALLIPAPVAGFIRLRGWKRGNWLRAAEWAGAWMAGAALMRLAVLWSDYPGDSLNYTCDHGGSSCTVSGPAVVSWGELPICAASLLLGVVMTWVLAVPVHGSEVPKTSQAWRQR